jgi:hypothetical protein
MTLIESQEATTKKSALRQRELKPVIAYYKVSTKMQGRSGLGLRVSAMARNDVAPARCISRMIGRTLAA